MTIRLLTLVAIATIGFTSGVTAMPRHYHQQPGQNYDAMVGAVPPHAIDHHYGVLQTGDTRTTATGGPSGGIN